MPSQKCARSGSARLALQVHMHRSVDKQEPDALLFHGESCG